MVHVIEICNVNRLLRLGLGYWLMAKYEYWLKLAPELTYTSYFICHSVMLALLSCTIVTIGGPIARTIYRIIYLHHTS